MATQQTAKTQFVELANGVKLAYRRIGKAPGIPLVMQIHFRGTMDYWDPALINRLAATRPVIIFDNVGVGESTGTIPSTFKGWGETIIALSDALNLKTIDLLGFSMGGCTVQLTALEAPHLVRKLILAGTSPSTYPNFPSLLPGPFVELASADSAKPEEVEVAIAVSNYPLTVKGRAAAKASWNRINERQGLKPLVDVKTAELQTASFVKWLDPKEPTNSHHRLGEIKIPVFVCNGDGDVLHHPDCSWELMKRIPSAHLHIYPNSGHMFLYQYAELFVTHVNLFLDEDVENFGDNKILA